MFEERWNRLSMLVLVSLMALVLVSKAVAQAPQQAPSKGLAAMERAAKENKYLFIFFFKQDDAATLAVGASRARIKCHHSFIPQR